MSFVCAVMLFVSVEHRGIADGKWENSENTVLNHLELQNEIK